eukprot:CAMPEP_0203667870 /NCGR_PEP_ID=MMETSP0090-20130426/4615_1 /ASSEMBLY_ACC=CAM_ASM_001088 /TAXON_ID=426623 /ORGANISM="Chaetoceros affinis, Strain CCMP159" /LENGTH=369 /DNA_ID=CAMNT_0050532147 /DNA_START=211 /DNA_END=1317 /DNA_ORIENTATION=-
MVYPKRVSTIVKNDDFHGGDCSDSGDGGDHIRIGKEGDEQVTILPTGTSTTNRQLVEEQSQSQSHPSERELCERQRGIVKEEECIDNMITGALILDGEDDINDNIGEYVQGNNNENGNVNVVGCTSSDHQYMMNVCQIGTTSGENNNSNNNINNGGDGGNGDGNDINNYNVILRTIEVETNHDFDNNSEEEMNDLSLNTIPPSVNMDMTTATIDEMIELFDEMKRKNYYLKIFSFSLSLIFIIVTSYLFHELHQMRRENQKLVIDLERLESEKVELVMMRDRDRMILEGREGGNGVVDLESASSDGAMSMFEINNCYLNVRTKVAMGQCTKDLYEKFNDWYYSHDGKYEDKEKQCLSKIWSDYYSTKGR